MTKNTKNKTKPSKLISLVLAKLNPTRVIFVGLAMRIVSGSEITCLPMQERHPIHAKCAPLQLKGMKKFFESKDFRV